MKKIAFWVSTPFDNDEMFNVNSIYNRDNCLAPFITMKNEFTNNDWEMHTQNYYINNKIKPDAILFMEIPEKKISLKSWGDVDLYALLCECEVIKPKNWDFNLHKQFKKIFTWRDDLIDNKKYFWTKDSPCLSNPKYRKTKFKEKKLLTLINSNKNSSHYLELYSKRLDLIEWFENNNPNSFDFYGIGWDKKKYSNIFLKPLNKIPFITGLLAKKYTCYKGMVKSKYETLDQYKFAVCFENAKNIPGYFTEKIFDCFLAGSIPIYYGANNITDYIPKNCFIDFKDFDNYQNLYNYLSSFSELDYIKYIENIDKFISSDIAVKFTPKYFADTIVHTINKDFLLEDLQINKAG